LQNNYPSKKLLIEIKGVEKIKFDDRSFDNDYTEKKKQEIFNKVYVICTFQKGFLSAG
jgi:hypothetical protein